MLGLYVSSHPLDGAERSWNATGTFDWPSCSGGRTEGTVKVSGIISRLDRKVTKNGDTWAILTLEDLDGGIECPVLPAGVPLYSG